MALAFAIPAAASAYTPYEVLPASGGVDAPVTLTRCAGGTNDYQADFEADLRVHSSVALRTIRIRFDFYDGFGERIESQTGDVNGNFGDGARLDGNRWTMGLNWFHRLPDVRRVRCSLERTLDAEGNVWKNATPAELNGTPAPSPTPNPRTPGNPVAPSPMLVDVDFSRTTEDGHPKFCHADSLAWMPWTHVKCKNYRVEWYREQSIADPYDKS